MITLQQYAKLQRISNICEEVMFYGSILLVTSWATLLGIVLFNGVWTLFKPILPAVYGLVGGSIVTGIGSVLILAITAYVHHVVYQIQNKL